VEKERPLAVVDGENTRRSRWPNLSKHELLERARKWAEREGVDLIVVFDGPAPDDGPDVVSVPYADDEIVRIVEEHDERPVWLVTSDRELRRRVGQRAVKTLGGGRFAGQI
jgi:predicted RNA-binding protein with PIN domain